MKDNKKSNAEHNIHMLRGFSELLNVFFDNKDDYDEETINTIEYFIPYYLDSISKELETGINE